VSWAPAPNRTQGADGSLVQNFEFGATFPLADSFVIRMKWIYRREYASNSLVGHDDTTWFSVTEKWRMEIIKDCGNGCLRFLTFLLFEARARHRLADNTSTSVHVSKVQKYNFPKRFNYKFWLRKVLIMIKSYLKLLPSHIHRNRCKMSSLCPSRGRLSGIELRMGWHNVLRWRSKSISVSRATKKQHWRKCIRNE
jgi:hypothetical protein